MTLGAGLPRGQARLRVGAPLLPGGVRGSQRQDLLRRYREGSLTAQEVGRCPRPLLAEAEGEAEAGELAWRARRRTLGGAACACWRSGWAACEGPPVPVWDVLASGYVSAATREQLLARIQVETLGLPLLTRRLTTIIEEAEAAPSEGGTASGQQNPGPRGRGRGTDAGPSSGQDADAADAARGPAGAGPARRHHGGLASRAVPGPSASPCGRSSSPPT